MSCICDVCARAASVKMCVCASLRRLNVKGCPTCTSATWRDQRAPFFVLRISIAVVGPAGRWWEAATPAVGGGDGRTPTVADARTCDADRYGMRVSCHMCAGSGKPSREWPWAETVKRTKGGGYARAFEGKTRLCRRDRADAARARDRNRIWGDIGSISVTIGSPGRCRAFSCARGGVRGNNSTR